jgi:hypothetical protein
MRPVAGKQGLSIGEVVYSQQIKKTTAGGSDANPYNSSVDMVQLVKNLHVDRGAERSFSGVPPHPAIGSHP